MTNAIDPGHYKGFSNGAQVIDISENLTSNAGQAVQYIARSCRLDGANKGDQIEDLTKAAWFIARELDRLAGIELAADKAKAAGLDGLWATWQEVPDGVAYRSRGGLGPWFNRAGQRMNLWDAEPSKWTDADMADYAPFVSAES